MTEKKLSSIKREHFRDVEDLGKNPTDRGKDSLEEETMIVSEFGKVSKTAQNAGKAPIAVIPSTNISPRVENDENEVENIFTKGPLSHREMNSFNVMVVNLWRRRDNLQNLFNSSKDYTVCTDSFKCDRKTISLMEMKRADYLDKMLNSAFNRTLMALKTCRDFSNKFKKIAENEKLLKIDKRKTINELTNKCKFLGNQDQLLIKVKEAEKVQSRMIAVKNDFMTQNKQMFLALTKKQAELNRLKLKLTKVEKDKNIWKITGFLYLAAQQCGSLNEYYQNVIGKFLPYSSPSTPSMADNLMLLGMAVYPFASEP